MSTQPRFFRLPVRFVPCKDQEQFDAAECSVVITELHWQNADHTVKEIVSNKTKKKHTIQVITIDLGNGDQAVVESFSILPKSAVVGVTFVPYKHEENATTA